MRRAIACVGAVIVAATMVACAQQPHTEQSMTAGTHGMQGLPKPGVMSNEVMPERSVYCRPENLAKMPPEHRAYCQSP